MDFTSALSFVLVIPCLLLGAHPYRPHVLTGFIIPKCDNEVNTLYASALHTFVNNVRSHIASGTGGQIINLTSEYITKPRHMDGMTYDCYTENIARGLLRRTPSDPHQGTGYTVNHFEKTHDQNGTLQQLLVDAYQFWLNDTEASLQRLIYPVADYMGCAMKDVENPSDSSLLDFKVVCVFLDHRPKGTPFLVEPTGKPCESDSDCSGGRSCLHSLCFVSSRSIIHH